MRKEYAQPETELIQFDFVDIITTSDEEGLLPNTSVPTHEDEGPRA